LAVVVVALGAPAAGAQTPPMTIPPPPPIAGDLVPGAADSLRGLAGGELGFGKIGDSYYLRVNVGTELDFGKIGLGIQAPFTLRPRPFFAHHSLPTNLAFGLPVLADAFAPVGTPGPVPTSGHEPSMANEAAVVLGFDVEFAVLKSKIVDVIPYSDYNHILG